ncbi:MAG: hypothetical protein R2713_22870 [Ilumatobacteraceae bacterium]
MDPTHDPAGPSPSDHPSPSDERIGALRRAAGAELRRPTPPPTGWPGCAANSVAARRRSPAPQASCSPVVIGALVFTGGDDRSTVVPATRPTTGVSVPATTTPDETTPDETTPARRRATRRHPTRARTPPRSPRTHPTPPRPTRRRPTSRRAADDPDVVYVHRTRSPRSARRCRRSICERAPSPRHP